MLSGGKGLLYDAPFKVFSLDGNRFGQFPSHTVPGSDLTRFQQMSIHSPEVLLVTEAQHVQMSWRPHGSQGRAMDFPAIFVGTQRVPEMTYQGSDPFHSKKNGVSLPQFEDQA